MFGRIVIMLTLLIMVCTTSAHASIGWIVYYEDAFQGKVIDTDTKEPIEGAVVVAGYAVREYSFVESGTITVDAKEVLTNKKGEFFIPRHFFLSYYPVAKGGLSDFIIYKPGYTAFPGDYEYFRYFPYSKDLLNREKRVEMFKRGVTIELKRLQSDEERMRNIPSGYTDMRAKKLPLLYRAINEEHRRYGLEEVK